MIPRYSRPEMVAIWSPETRFRIWFEIETHATTALADLGVVPREAAEAIWRKGANAAFAEFERCKIRLIEARREVSTCAISGAVGTFANIDPAVEEYVAEKMGLSVEPISTQVIPRDRHAMFFATLAVIASSIERLATEIRHLQRSEVLEAEEYFSAGQKGSSAMPHKRNPVLTENLTRLARMVRAYVTPALENVVLWHERDISHSSAERMIGPDATVTLDFALMRLAGLIDKLLVYPENMRRNLDRL